MTKEPSTTLTPAPGTFEKAKRDDQKSQIRRVLIRYTALIQLLAASAVTSVLIWLLPRGDPKIPAGLWQYCAVVMAIFLASWLVMALLVGILYIAVSREDDTHLGIEEIRWDPLDPEKSLRNLCKHDTQFARTKVKWYLEDAEICGVYAKWIRVAALLFGAAGALVPLIESALRLPEPQQIAQWGYVLIAVSVAILALDRFGGFTWRWIRSTVIWVSLRRELAMFQHDWIRLCTAPPPPPPPDPANPRNGSPKDLFQARHDRVAKFRSDVETIIAQECKDWAVMTEQRGTELQQSIDRQVSGSPKG